MQQRKFTVYTDSSCRKRKCCTSCLILDEEQGYFIAELIKSYFNMTSSDGERRAILNALRFLKSFEGCVSITVYSDDLTAVNTINSVRDADCSILKKIRVLLQEMQNVTIEHTPAHTGILNPNAVCDITARRALNTRKVQTKGAMCHREI